MEEYRSNSFKSKEESKKKPVIEKVINGKAQVKKKSDFQKLTEVFLPEDIHSVKDKIVKEIAIPAIKKFISDGVDMILYGDGGGNRKKQKGGSTINYGGFWYSGDSKERDKPARNSGRNIYDFNNLLFETRGDAEMVLDSMQEIISNYESVSVADLYDLADVEIENSSASNYGWYNLQSAKAVGTPDGGYILRLPKPVVIN